jgi:hypothetical protein
MLVKRQKQGRLAQLVELLPYKQAVTGSSPVPSILLRLQQEGLVCTDELVFKNPDGLPIDYQLKHFIFLAHPPFTKIHHRLVNIFQPRLIFFRR